MTIEIEHKGLLLAMIPTPIVSIVGLELLSFHKELGSNSISAFKLARFRVQGWVGFEGLHLGKNTTSAWESVGFGL